MFYKKFVVMLLFITSHAALYTAEFGWMDDVAEATIEKMRFICENRTAESAQQILQAVQNDDIQKIKELCQNKQLFNAYDSTKKQFAIEIVAQQGKHKALTYFLTSMTPNDMTTLENTLKEIPLKTSTNEQISRIHNLMRMIFTKKQTIDLFFEKITIKNGVWCDCVILMETASHTTDTMLAYALEKLDEKPTEYDFHYIKLRALNMLVTEAIENNSQERLVVILEYLKKTNSYTVLNKSNRNTGDHHALVTLILKKFEENRTLNIARILKDYGATITTPTETIDNLMYQDWDCVTPLHAALKHPSASVLAHFFYLTQQQLSQDIDTTACLAYAIRNNSYSYETIHYLFNNGAAIDNRIKEQTKDICTNTSTTAKILHLFFEKVFLLKTSRRKQFAILFKNALQIYLKTTLQSYVKMAYHTSIQHYIRKRFEAAVNTLQKINRYNALKSIKTFFAGKKSK